MTWLMREELQIAAGDNLWWDAAHQPNALSATTERSGSKGEREGNIICEVIFHFKFLKSPIYICETNGNVCAKIAQTADTMPGMAYARLGILLFFHQYYLGADKSEVNPSQFFRYFLAICAPATMDGFYSNENEQHYFSLIWDLMSCFL